MILLPVFLIVVFSLTQIANATEVKGLYRSQTIVTERISRNGPRILAGPHECHRENHRRRRLRMAIVSMRCSPNRSDLC